MSEGLVAVFIFAAVLFVLVVLTTRQDFYESDNWQFLRINILRIFGNRCMSCGGLNREMHVDHIKPRSKFPELELDPMNLQVLCRACNKKKGNRHARDYRSFNDMEASRGKLEKLGDEIRKRQ